MAMWEGLRESYGRPGMREPLGFPGESEFSLDSVFEERRGGVIERPGFRFSSC